MAATASRSEECIKTISLESMAISLPAPMAIPISASVKATASLIPSPTIATFPYFLSSLITSCLSRGKAPALTYSMPAFEAMAFAVLSLSPVTMIGVMPSFLNCSTAFFESSLIGSETAMIPIKEPLFAKNNGVLPAFANSSAEIRSFSPKVVIFSKNDWEPARYSSPSITAFMPFPTMFSNDVAFKGFKDSSFAFATIAFAKG